MKKYLLVALAIIFIFGIYSYSRAYVNLFGGQASQVIPCYNDVIFAKVGPPRPERLIWVPGITRTYEYSYPKHAGQWMLGLYGLPFYCIASVSPIIPIPGYVITMMGASW